MKMEEDFDEVFDLKSNFPDDMIYSTSKTLISNANDIIRQPETYCEPDQAWKITNYYNTIKAKQLMMNSTDLGNSKYYTAQEIISSKPCSSSASDPSKLFSFENPNPFLQEISDYANPVSSEVISFSSSENGKSSKKDCGAVRTPLQAKDHLMAERKRREKLGQLFISLSKTVPGIKKLDKASLLEDAINYTKALQERLSILEKEQASNKTSMNESKETVNSSIKEISNKTTNESEAANPRIKVRISNRSVLIKICCKKHKGFMSTIHLEMEKMNLSLVDTRVMPFGSTSLDITILAQVHSEFCGTAKDIVDQLEIANFMNPDQ